MAKPDTEQQPALQIPEVYSNVANIHFNQYEFEVTIGLGSANYEGVKPAVNMRMSPQFAKELAKILRALFTTSSFLQQKHGFQVLL